MSTPPIEPGEGHDDQDIDAEFARMMQGVELDAPDLETPETPGPEASGPEDSVPSADGTTAPGMPEELTVEDITAAAGQGDQPTPIAVVATSVASAKALAGAVRLGKEAREDGIELPAGTRIHGTGTGAIALGELSETEAHDLAAIVSTALQRHGVVLFWRRGDRMTATRYREGERGDDVSPALVLGAVDGAVEQLLLGAITPAELPGSGGRRRGKDDEAEGIDPSAISRAQALTWLATGRRRP